MSALLRNHSFASAWRRLRALLGGLGLGGTCSLLAGTIDDRWFKTFDRRYRVKTSGFIVLNQTSFNPERLRDATQYGPTNGWAVRRIFKRLNLPRESRFCDVGSGLGRICILAAEYGFAKTTGVELAAEFCEVAQANIATCRLPPAQRATIEIRQMDALDYCATSDDDVFFMFRPFSGEFLGKVLDKLAARSRERRRPLTIIYSERAMVGVNHADTIAAHGAFQKKLEAIHWGQAFYVFESARSNPGTAK
ncbi:MAG: hypothetical protein RLY20_1606 [Verrucomicrobiota bacterium]|jgi:16S rRNA G966 N2-methylase RsmD